MCKYRKSIDSEGHYTGDQNDRRDPADPTIGMSQTELEKKYGTVAAHDKNYMDGIRQGLSKDHSYSGGFWWPKSTR